MNSTQVRLCLSLVAALAITGCSQSDPVRPAAGNLPGQDPLSTDEPIVNSSTYFAHGHLLERQGQFERAVIQYRKALALQPGFLTARNRLGITLNKLSRNTEASEHFRLALALHPELAYLHNNLGFSLYLEKKYDEAITSFETALELNPDFARAHMNYAMVLAQFGKFDQAFDELCQAGSQVDAYFNMGVILTKAEKFGEAAQYLEAALAANPNFDAARQQLLEVSRLAAEYEARQAASPALATEVPAENGAPEDGEDNVEVEVAAAPVSPAPEPSTPPKPSAANEEPQTQVAATEETPPATVNIETVATDAPAPATEPLAPVEEPQTQVAATEETPAPDMNTETVALDTPATEPAAENANPDALHAQAPAAANAEPAPIANAAKPNSSSLIIEDVPINRPGKQMTEKDVAHSAESTNLESATPTPTPTHKSSVVIIETIDLTPQTATANSASAPEQPVAQLPDDELAAVEVEPATALPTTNIDDEALMIMINDALYALQYNPDEFETLWCEVSYYLFPETAPIEQSPIGK